MTLDFPQIAVATAATASYAFTSVALQRAYIQRRKRQVRQDARFVKALIQGARDGTVQTLSDASALFCAGTARHERGEPGHRFEFLISRACSFLVRRSLRTGVVEATDRRRVIATLRRLEDECQTATTAALVQRAGISSEDRDRIQLEVARSLKESADVLPLEPVSRARRRERQRRTAAMVRQALMGLGCIAFVQVVLVVWQSLH